MFNFCNNVTKSDNIESKVSEQLHFLNSAGLEIYPAISVEAKTGHHFIFRKSSVHQSHYISAGVLGVRYCN